MMVSVDGDLRVALAGKFSCGKSSFINSALGESLAPVKLERTTRCATNFRYGEVLRISDASGQVYTREEYQEKAAATASAAREFTIELPVEMLRDVVIVDTPGFDPVPEDVGDGSKTDAEISREAVGGADIVLFLAEMGDGTIQRDSMDYLKEIAAAGKAFYLILSKADQKLLEEQREAIHRSICAECEHNGLRPRGMLPYCAIREDKLPSSVRKEALKWRRQLQDELKRLSTFKQTLQGRRNQAMVDNYVANVQHFLNKNLRFFKAMRSRIDDRPAQTSNKTRGQRLTNKQQIIAESMLDALCGAIFKVFTQNLTETCANRIYRLRPDLIRSQLFDSFPVSDSIKNRIFLFLEDYSDDEKAEGMRQILTMFAHMVSRKTAEVAETWPFVSPDLESLRHRFALWVLDKLDCDTFLDGVAEVLKRLQAIDQNSHGQPQVDEQTQGDLTQWLDELIAFAQ